MKKFLLFHILLLLTCNLSKAQQSVQTIRGKVLDKQSEVTLPGAIIKIKDSPGSNFNATTDVNGNFRIEKVPVGRYTLQVQLLGYNDAIFEDVIVSAAKEVIMEVKLEEKVYNLKSAEIVAARKTDVVNEMAVVSARAFTIEETNRYAGSRGDPARMVSNYAGVQGGDDARNDIVIRGNSPMGLLWRIECVDIPNPNHFAVPGTTGSAVTILNEKIFGNSDFYTGAFPAEYGNALAGVFDIRIRNGNNEKHEFTGQFGFLGTEIAAEGPLSKKHGSSYLVTYRYSTLKIFSLLNIKIGTDAVPSYMDGSFKLNFPTKKAGVFSFFGVGGTSKINIIMSDKSPDDIDIYADQNRDEIFGTSTAFLGTTHSINFNSKTFMRTTLAVYGSQAHANHSIFYRDTNDFSQIDTTFKKLDYKFISSKITINSSLNTKFNSRLSMKYGIVAEMLHFNFIDSNFVESTNTWDLRLDYSCYTYLIQPYAQIKYKQSDQLVFTLGLHGQYLTLNGSYAIEPRAGVHWSFGKNQALSLGYGMHNQMQPTYIYFQQRKNAEGIYTMINKDIGFTRAQHIVLGYENAFGKGLRFKVETYYQYLDKIPINVYSSSFSLINQGSSFSRFFPDSLTNKGTAYNYGIELTIEKVFLKSYYFMVTGSLYQSKYKGSDGIKRNTDYNGMFALNSLFGKEFKLGKKTLLITGVKATWAGGKWYTPADLKASTLAGELVEMDSLRNTLKSNNYFRLDIKLGIKVNSKNLTHEIAIDLVNVFNTKNEMGIIYAPSPTNPNANPLIKQYQLGFLPLFYYKIDF